MELDSIKVLSRVVPADDMLVCAYISDLAADNCDDVSADDIARLVARIVQDTIRIAELEARPTYRIEPVDIDKLIAEQDKE